MEGDRVKADAADEIESFVAGVEQFDTSNNFIIWTAHNTIAARDQYPSSSWMNLNAIYKSNTDQYQTVYHNYNLTPTMPMFLIESTYEYLDITTQQVRRQAYWPILSGAIGGSVLGIHNLWGFNSAWPTLVESPGSISMRHLHALFLSRTWYRLVPDQTHTVVTAGYGSGASYVTTARTDDGKTIMSYIPTGASITAALSQISGSQARAWWFNPRTGTSTLISTYPASGSQVFTTPTTEDWVLVIDDAALNLPAPGTLNGGATPPSSPKNLRIVTGS